jgi:hypothetical protein
VTAIRRRGEGGRIIRSARISLTLAALAVAGCAAPALPPGAGAPATPPLLETATWQLVTDTVATHPVLAPTHAAATWQSWNMDSTWPFRPAVAWVWAGTIHVDDHCDDGWCVLLTGDPEWVVVHELGHLATPPPHLTHLGLEEWPQCYAEAALGRSPVWLVDPDNGYWDCPDPIAATVF